MTAGSLSWSVAAGDLDPYGEAGRQVWSRDPMPNPFCAPAFLRAMAETGERLSRVAVTAIGRAADGRAAALWPLALDRHGALCFVTHEYAYHCTAIAAPEVTADELAEGLVAVLTELQPASVSLTQIPSWGHTLEAARRGLDAAGWPARIFEAKSCPALVCDSPQALHEAFRKQRGRQRWNRLRRDVADVELEVAEDAGELDAWCGAYVRAHRDRWDGTATPSMYGEPFARELLRRSLRAWCDDGVLVRFTIRSSKGALAYMCALRAGDRLLGNLMAIPPAGAEHAAGTVLTWLVGCWAGENGFSCYDFGVGGEEYKYRYANADEKLWRAFAARRRLSLAYGRGWLEERIRANPALQRAWEDFVNRQIRERMRKARIALRR